MAELMTADLAVTAGRLVTPTGVRAGTVLIADGRVLAVLEPGAAPPPG